MGFLGTLGKIAGFAAPIVAAPFTGGASLLGLAGVGGGTAAGIGAGLGALGSVGSVLGKQEAGKAAGKEAQAQLQLARDRSLIDLYQAQQGAQNQAAATDLARKQFEFSNRGGTAKQALLAELLGGGFKPTSISVPGIAPANVQGGLAASLAGNPNIKGIMATLGEQARTAQNTPLQFKGGELISAPQLAPLPQIDKGGFLSTLARVGELAGAASPYIKRSYGNEDELPHARL